MVLIRGRGNTFCAGADLNMLDAEFLGTTNNSVKIAQVSARTFDRAFNLSKPTIAVVEGYAVAGGFELMISCDFASRRRRPDRRLPHPPRAVRRRRADLPPAALHRPAQDQGAPAHRQAAVRQGVRGLGSGQRVGAVRRSSTRPIADFVAPMLDKSAFTMRITKLAANRGLDGDTETLIALESMTCNVAHQSQDAQARACRPSSRSAIRSGSTLSPPSVDHADGLRLRRTRRSELQRAAARVHGRVRLPRGAALPRRRSSGRRPLGHAARARGAQGRGARARPVEPVPAPRPTSTAPG